MNAKLATVLALVLLTGCMSYNHYPEQHRPVKTRAVFPDFTGLTEDEKRAMGLLTRRRKLAPVGAPFDLSRYDGTLDDVRQCIIELSTSSAVNKDYDICYEPVPTEELRRKFKNANMRHLMPNTIYIIHE